MANPVAIITGAGGGIGRACAIELTRRGYRAVLVGRTESTLSQTQLAIQSLAPSPTPLPAYQEKESEVLVGDVTRVENVDSIVEKALARFGRIDALVNNAGVAPVLDVEQTTPAIWHEVLETNLSSAFYLCRAVWPNFKKRRSGVIVNISSMAARDPFPGFIAYGAAKAALVNLGLSLAKEGSSIGVRVYTVAPGAVETPMLRKILSPQQLPSENILAPEDVAGVVGDCVAGTIDRTSGEVIWLSK